jgi:23S rRNA pseudouridine2605 synthase
MYSKIQSLRLERIISNRGSSSRSEASALIKQGRVRVEGLVVRSPSQKFPENSTVTVDGKQIDEVPLLVAFNKPLNVLSTMGDPSGRPSLVDLIPESWVRMGLHPVGRLDADTTGLLLFSSDGQLTQRLLHPSGGVEREYIARVEGDAMRTELTALLAAGVETSEGAFPAKLLEQKENEVRLIVTEGKYRMVRRILANVGLPVLDLHRARYGHVILSELDLSPGTWCPAPEEAVRWARGLLK